MGCPESCRMPENLIGRFSGGHCNELLKNIPFKTKGRAVKIKVVRLNLARGCCCFVCFFVCTLLIEEDEDMLKISMFFQTLEKHPPPTIAKMVLPPTQKKHMGKKSPARFLGFFIHFQESVSRQSTTQDCVFREVYS